MDETHDDDKRHLAELVGELDPQIFRTTLTTSASGRPELVVTNRSSGRMSESVRVGDGDYRWSWGQRIAPVGERVLAARRIAQVLSAVES